MKNEIIKSNVPRMSIAAFRTEGHKAGPIAVLHYHDEMEFLPVYSGTFCCVVDEKTYTAKAGDVIFVNSSVPHSTFCPEAGASTGLVQFRMKDFQDSEIERAVRYSIKFRSSLDEPVRIISDKDFFDAITNIIEESVKKQTAYEMFIKSEIYRALGILYRLGILSDGEALYQKKEVQKILPALTYMHEHYGEEITLATIAGTLGFDSSYFCRIFRTATGTTFTEYLNFVRICQAEKLLMRTQDSVFEVAAAVGIPSVSYFDRIFKKYHNCSPSVFRAAQYCSDM